MSYFHFETPDNETLHLKLNVERCHYIKGDGQQCKNRVCIGTPFCHIHRKYEYKLKIMQSTIPNAGIGLFVQNDEEPENAIIVKKNAKICPYAGEIINREELLRRYGDYTAPYGIQISNDIYEDGAVFRGIGSLINHSRRNANCRFSVGRNKKINIVAIKNIRNGKELFVDYGNDYVMHEYGVVYKTNRNKYKF